MELSFSIFAKVLEKVYDSRDVTHSTDHSHQRYNYHYCHSQAPVFMYYSFCTSCSMYSDCIPNPTLDKE